MMAQLISQRAYARSRAARGLPGGALSAVQKAAATGRITLVDGKIDPEAADRAWEARTDVDQQTRGALGGYAPKTTPATAPAPASPEIPAPSAVLADVASDRDTYFAHRARRELVAAQLAELDLAEKRGALVRRIDVERETFATMRALRDRMLGVADRIAAQVAAEADVATVHEIIVREVRDSLRRVTEVIEGSEA